jgi:hypothetical protein
MKILAVLLTLIVALASGASSQNYKSAMAFDMGYVAGPPGWTPWQDFPAMPPIGAPLWIVGTAGSFAAPLEGLAPAAGTYEATYVIEGLSCDMNAYWDAPDGRSGIGSCFVGGFLRIDIDDTPDVNPADASTYRDGELVLEASVSGDFCLNDSDYLCPLPGPTAMGHFVFTGGSWFSHVSDGNGQGYTAWYEGCFWENISEALRQLGYAGRTDQSVIDVQGPISTEKATWGKIKALYR